MFRKVVLVASLAGLLGGCAQRAYTVRAPFNPDSVSWALKTGSDILSGQAFMRTVGGDVKTCAGSPVALVPYDSYFSAVAQANVEGYSSITNTDPRANAYVRKTKCDVQGGFSFSNLPTGQWIVVTKVVWGVPNGYFVVPQGGPLSLVADTSPSSDTKVLLTK